MQNELTTKEAADGWKLLFDGQTFDGWVFPRDGHGWAIDDGCMACLKPVGRSRNVYTEAKYENFIFKVEYRTEEDVNSGIFIRTSDLADPVNTGLEMQILDDFDTDELTAHTCAAIYDLVPTAERCFKPAGEWNTVVITCDGPIVEIEHNGIVAARMNTDEYTEVGVNPDGSTNKFRYAWADLPRAGHIGFQDHQGKIWFRNVKIKEL